ncbi:conserved hypothetical protein [Thiomonas arsenitoxydans]|uniref:Uncharacterized protein n=1 Tax=Thiomonas arsenitoxydans (strain DSM 22701 / CIP 110005 / 3As) TaxID=426114 RepID=D6CQ65_THIA3|nr:hypothetical protein THI_1462 [Thiomonas arsenitoxydans]CQR32491.1 conserved hypothetical protein [Thiomonas arsenitoxydans]CQR32834.1 conserved hypothetical protein [Thiomonas arsenitoxydans]CQR34172.1 conserved hypothetical protein [Thiomonas arsenitoxydans]CQR40450.1 conserved hypothetical protein [Thiomonas arsenitoxydans]
MGAGAAPPKLHRQPGGCLPAAQGFACLPGRSAPWRAASRRLELGSPRRKAARLGPGAPCGAAGWTPWPHGAAVAPLHTRLRPVLRAMLAEATGTVCKQTVRNGMVTKAGRIRPSLSH